MSPEEIEKYVNEAEATLDAPAPADVFLGGGEEIEPTASERAAELRAVEDIELENRKADRIEKLEQQLFETQKLVRELMAKGASLPEIAEETREREWAGIRAAWYEHLQQDGKDLVILLLSDPDPSKNWPVPVYLNGAKVEIKRGRQQVVPWWVPSILDAARISHVEPLVDSNGNPEQTHTVRQMYPYQVIRSAVPEPLMQ